MPRVSREQARLVVTNEASTREMVEAARQVLRTGRISEDAEVIDTVASVEDIHTIRAGSRQEELQTPWDRWFDAYVNGRATADEEPAGAPVEEARVVGEIEPPWARTPEIDDSELFADEAPYSYREDDYWMPRASDFPSYELEGWDMGERDTVANNWQRQMSYRLQWIFYREEREGVSRTRYIRPFCPDDFKEKVNKTTSSHPMNTPTSTFYDWKIGGTDFVMRLESFKVRNRDCLRCHFIHKPTDKEICYQDRYWDGSAYQEANMVWASSK